MKLKTQKTSFSLPLGFSTSKEGNLILTDYYNPVVALTNKNNSSTAVLTFSVGELAQQNNQRVQLLPDGIFKSIDGRPGDVESGHWLMDEVAFTNLKSNAAMRENDFLFDYEHQTLRAEENGKPAPASGWFKPEDLVYVPGQGLFAENVQWTSSAALSIQQKEYRYASAVFSYDQKTGRPISLMHAALTNDPALDGMKAIAALKNNQSNFNNQSNTNPIGENSMDKALVLLLSLLGIEHENNLDPAAALKLVNDNKVAIAALKKSTEDTVKLQGQLTTANASIVALKATGETGVDLTKFVPIAAYNAQLTQVAALTAQSQTGGIAQLMQDNSDKFVSAEEEYLTSFGEQQGVAALKKMFESRPAIAALKSTQTKEKKKPESHGHGNGLSQEQIAVCKAMGISQENYKKQLDNANDNTGEA